MDVPYNNFIVKQETSMYMYDIFNTDEDSSITGTVYGESQYDEFNRNDSDDDYDDSMDGDFDSGMASAGYGTDEDYFCFGSDE
jgi:hypothetical protein